MARTDWINLVLFKIGWVVAVYGGDAWLMAQLLVVAGALWAVRPTGIVLGIVLGVCAVGIARDILLVMTGALDMGGSVMPVWLALLWLQFALVLQRGMHWLSKLSQPIQVAVGVVTGGLAYFTAVALGAAEIGDGFRGVLGAWTFIALSWGVLLWLQLRITSYSTLHEARS